MKKFYLMIFAVVTLSGMLAISGCKKNEEEEPELATTGELNGHAWVDLGLPSGTKWATCNVGATTPEGYGNYYAWGETIPKETYTWENYKYAANAQWDYAWMTKYCSDSTHGYNGYTDTLTTLESCDDVATTNWGSGWHIPTAQELYELYKNCTWTYTTLNSIKGWQITGSNSNSIFLPAAGSRWEENLYNIDTYGLYWAREFIIDDDLGALAFGFDMSHDYEDWGFSPASRCIGGSVRPVCMH